MTITATDMRPTAQQLRLADLEMGLFLHFGIRTFFEGHEDWDGKPMPADQFNPTDFDPHQWASIAREAGFGYMVMTTKHHDGFALWPSKASQYTVAQSPWRGGRGDVVRDYVDACRAHDLAVGLYYSPAEPRVHQLNTDAQRRDYDRYILDQFTELLTEYGPISILWLDGCGSESHAYDWAGIMSRVRQLQPEVLVFSMGDPDYRWVGNEAGLAPRACWNVTDHVPLSINAVDASAAAEPEPRWLQPECDCRIRDFNWFYGDADVDTVKSVEELLALYDYSVGRGANMLLNVGPDRRGLLPEPDASRLRAFGEAVRRRYPTPIATANDFQRQGNTWVHELSPAGPGQRPGFCMLDQVVLMEDIAHGQRIERFAIKVKPWPHGRPITVYEGRTVGHKTVCRFPVVRTHEVIVEVTATQDEPALRQIALYRTGPDKLT